MARIPSTHGRLGLGCRPTELRPLPTRVTTNDDDRRPTSDEPRATNDDEMTRHQGSHALGAALGTGYVTHFGALAASAPFLALLLGDAGFTAEATAQVLALCLLVRIASIPTWTVLADRLNAAGVILSLTSGAALGVLGLLVFAVHPAPALVAVALVAFSFFRAPFGPLLDSLTLHLVQSSGRSFGGIRAWGTAGFAVSALLTGALVARRGSSAVLLVSLGFLTCATGAAVALGRGEAARHATRARAREAFALMRQPRVALLLAVTVMQEMGIAPYDALFPAYLTKLSGATSAGAAVSLGASSEFLMLLAGATLVRRWGAERLLTLACAASVVRWATMAVVTNPVALVALQSMHALSFGAFYLASVLLLDAETPPQLRASAQGLFNALCFGVAAAIGVSLAGLVESWAGPRPVFAVAAVAAAAATLLALRLERMPSRAPSAPVQA